MKTTFVLAAVAAAFLFSGCATTNQKNAGAFLARVATLDITAADVSQSTVTPFYSHSESVSGLTRSEGRFSVQNLKADFTVPLWGVSWKFSASAITASNPQVVAKVAEAANRTTQTTQ